LNSNEKNANVFIFAQNSLRLKTPNQRLLKSLNEKDELDKKI